MKSENQHHTCDALPSVDFGFQFSAEREYNKVEKKIFTQISKISDYCHSAKKSMGLIVVLGTFDNNENHIVYGMRQIGINPIQKYLNICSTNFKDEVTKLFKQNYDGAIIVNRSGQILGARIYLSVDKPSLEVPDGCGTRHITAASVSTRDGIIAVFTLSEESLVVRTWKSGSFVEQYNPNENNINNE